MKFVKILLMIIIFVNCASLLAFAFDGDIEIEIKRLEDKKTELSEHIEQKDRNIKAIETEIKKREGRESEETLKDGGVTEKKYCTFTYVIKRGDTLWDLAGKFLGNKWNYMIIVKYNTKKIKNPDLIVTGDKIIMLVKKDLYEKFKNAGEIREN